MATVNAKGQVFVPLPITKAAKVGILITIIYVTIRVVPIDVLIAFGLLLAFIGVIAKLKWTELRQKGIVNCFPPKIKAALLSKSILDMYCDLVYFPLISLIIKAFAKPLITHPTPDKIFSSFSDLPPHIRDAIATKGILHLAPQKIEKVMLRQDMGGLDESYGKVDPTWYNKGHYEVVSVHKPPKMTLKHQILSKVTDIKWHYLLVFSFLMIHMGKKYSNIQVKQFLSKRSFEVGVILCIISAGFTVRKILRHFKKPSHSKLLKTDSTITTVSITAPEA